MADTRDKHNKSNSAPVARSPVDSAAKPATPGEASQKAGRVVHDERGNAVWNWVKDTGRFCIESTSALLKRLDIADLKVEGQKEEQLRLEDDSSRDAGGGYDPYNQKGKPAAKGKPPGRK